MPLSQQAVVWGGRAVLLTLSDASATGYLNVLKQPGNRRKPYYAKFKPDGETGQRTLPGSSSATAWEAAAKLAYYSALKDELPDKEVRGRRRTAQVRFISSP